MISRRRNLFVILLMSGLLLASLVVIITKETRLGLDLKGGVELVYQGEPTPQSKVTPEAVDRSIDIIRERVDQLGVAEPEIQRIGSDQISVGLPGRQGSRPREEAGRHHGPALLLRLGAERHRQPADAAAVSLRRGQEGRASASRSWTTTTRPGPVLPVQERDRTLAAGPDTSRKDLLSEFNGRVPPGSEILHVPPGTRRACAPRAGRPAQRTSRSTATSC